MHTNTFCLLCPVHVPGPHSVVVWVLVFVSREPLLSMFAVDCTVKASQILAFLTRYDRKSNYAPSIWNMHVKLFLYGE